MLSQASSPSHYLEVCEWRHKEVRDEPEGGADSEEQLKLVYAEAPVSTQPKAPHLEDHLQVKENGEPNLRTDRDKHVSQWYIYDHYPVEDNI